MFAAKRGSLSKTCERILLSQQNIKWFLVFNAGYLLLNDSVILTNVQYG